MYRFVRELAVESFDVCKSLQKFKRGCRRKQGYSIHVWVVKKLIRPALSRAGLFRLWCVCCRTTVNLNVTAWN